MTTESFKLTELIKSVVGASFDQLPQGQTSRKELTLNLRKLLTQLESRLSTVNRLII